MNSEDVINNVNRQIKWIAMNGCTNIKCKNCYMKGVCDHVPAHSRDMAIQIIKAAQEKKNDY